MKKIIKVGIVFLIFVVLGGVIFFVCFSKKDVSVKKKDSVEKSFSKKPVKENLWDKGDLFYSYYELADQVVSKMSLEELIGQLFLVRYDQTTASSQIQQYFPGGYILFAKDFQNHTKESITGELAQLQSSSRYPLMFGVDEEGGYVTRVSRYPNFRQQKFPSPKAVYEQGGYDLLAQVEQEKAELLLSLGIHLNLAPVVDVSTNPNDFIYNRAFGRDATLTAEFASKMVGYANQANISSCLKHFPGYGNNVDTHTGSAYDNRSYENFVQNDFLPFKSGIEASVPAILVSHNVVTSIDPNYPSSLSAKVIGELRNTLHFSGIILTDDLAMDAVSDYVQNGSAAVLAIQAGNDMIITSSFETMYQEVYQAVIDQVISREVLEKAVLRIIAWKYKYGLF